MYKNYILLACVEACYLHYKSIIHSWVSKFVNISRLLRHWLPCYTYCQMPNQNTLQCYWKRLVNISVVSSNEHISGTKCCANNLIRVNYMSSYHWGLNPQHKFTIIHSYGPKLEGPTPLIYYTIISKSVVGITINQKCAKMYTT